jgi:3',5'-cyclic AMP phosphodiesterase CpdA
MSRIAHLSDLHFGREQPELVAALHRQLHRLRPDLVAISGDLTQRARPRELAAAADFVAALPTPVLVVPGNHDIPGVTPRRFFGRWHAWRRHFPYDLEPEVHGEGFSAIGANSVRAWGPYLDWSRGRLRAEQIRRLAARIAAIPDARLRILVAHHPLLTTPAGAHRGEVGGASDALSALARAELDLALGGHVHLAYVGIREGVLIAHAGTGVSDRLVGESNGFNVIEGDRRALEIRHWYWSGADFAPGACRSFRRATDGWREQPAGC